jgi:hypothetical protein
MIFHSESCVVRKQMLMQLDAMIKKKEHSILMLRNQIYDLEKEKDNLKKRDERYSFVCDLLNHRKELLLEWMRAFDVHVSVMSGLVIYFDEMCYCNVSSDVVDSYVDDK